MAGARTTGEGGRQTQAGGSAPGGTDGKILLVSLSRGGTRPNHRYSPDSSSGKTVRNLSQSHTIAARR